MAKLIYRQGKDIYDASTQTRIGETDFKQNYSGQATELTPIDGAKYNTRELQQSNFDNIQPIGNTLYGVAKQTTPPAQPTQPKTDDITSQLPSQTTQDVINEAFVNSSKANLETQKKSMMEIYNKQLEDVKRKQEEYNAKIEKSEAKQDQAVQGVEELTQPFQEDLEKSERERLKIDENYFANQKSITELETLLNSATSEIEAAKSRPGLASVKQGQVYKIQTDYKGRVGVIEAVMSARTDQINMAYTMIDRTVSAINADRENQLSYYNLILGMAETDIETAESNLLTLDEDEKDIIKNQIGMVQTEMEEAQATADMIKSLMTDPEYATIVEKAGVSLSDTSDQVAEKIQKYFVNNPQDTESLSFDQKLELYEKGLVLDETGSVSKDYSTNQSVSLLVGPGVITGFGSKYWEPGLDFVLAGGKGAEVKSPFIGEVVFAGKNGGFGNQVKISTGSGEEIWLSHLDSINVKVGDQVNEEAIVGKQGNTGNVYSTSGGDGTHLDITIKKPDGSFYGAQEVAKILGYRDTNIPDTQTDDPVSLDGLSERAKAVYNEPLLLNNYTSTEKGKILDEILGAGLDFGGTKALSDGAIKDISQTEAAIANLYNLKEIVSNNLEYIGPISGLQKYNPWSKARKAQAEIDRVRQTVGKALEGGVLRKEDEEKYKKILATLNDTPDTAFYKIDSLITSLERDIDNYKKIQSDSGRYVPENTSSNRTSTGLEYEIIDDNFGETSSGLKYTIIE